jgi:acyl-coenzyme A thioesterase PaaI-like protein
MALRALDNAAWGFDSNCFVCGPGNERGLRIPYAHDDEAATVTAEFRLGPEFSGAPRYVHGGVLLAILDEAMAWAAIAVAGRFAVVQSTAATFDRPVRVGEPHTVEATIAGAADAAVTARSSIADAGGRCCVTAHARLVVMSRPIADVAIGPVSGDDARYLRTPQEAP